MSIDIKSDAIFFMFFGEPLDTIKESNLDNLARVCAQKAYRDVCRTIEYKGLCKEGRNGFRETVVDEIVNAVVSLYSNAKSFEDWHTVLCENIIQKAIEGDEKFSFHWGQAQKWVNMTLKYLRLMGVRFDSIEAEMHIPIDSYIIEAAAESSDDDLVEGIAVKGLGIKLDWDKTWSRCDDKGKYSTFQGAVREKTDNKQLEWEEKAWMAMAIRHAAEGR